MSINKVVLFGEKAAGVYRMSDIYFPEEVNHISPEQAGKIVPAVGSLVVDDTKGLHNQQYTVVDVDPNTYYPTLIPSTFSYDTSSQPDRVLNYGNDLLMLYFQKTTIQKNGQSIIVNRLIVDNKLSLFGNHAATYQLLRYDDNGKLQTISRWYRPDGMVAGTAIPMLDTGVDGIRKCDGCYTDVDLTEGEMVVCRIYSAAAVQISELTLIAKKAHLLNELASVANPIIKMVIQSNQLLSKDTLFLYTGQNPEELTIFPHLIYSDGNDVRVAIDGLKGFVYGLEDIRTEISGMEYRLLIKYYLGDDDIVIGEENKYSYVRTSDTKWQSDKSYYTRSIIDDCWVYSKVPASSYTVGQDISSTTEYFEQILIPIHIDESQSVKFMTKEVTVRILNIDYEKASKISMIPVWNSSAGRWGFEFLKYMEKMHVSPIPVSANESTTTYLKFGTKSESVYGSDLSGAQQFADIKYRNIIGESYVDATQRVYFALFNKNTVQDLVYWQICSTQNGQKIYGRNTETHPRPRIIYRTTAASSGLDSGKTKYFIPLEVFHETSNQTAQQVFLDNFYYQADPPVSPDSSSIVIPTHFIIKDLSGRIISKYNNTPAAEIPISEFSSMLYLKKSNGNAATNDYVNTTLIMEFIRREGNTDKYIYGVPVDVITG